MTRKKTIESVQEIQPPKALLVNGAELSSCLAGTLQDRGCTVTKMESYSPTPHKFDYIFLFDNANLADEVYEKNLSGSGKFILVLSDNEKVIPFRNKFKILKAGDTSSWSLPELTEKILSFIFSSDAPSVVDLSRKPKVTFVQKKEIPNIQNVIPSKVEGSLANASSNDLRDSSVRPSDLVGMTKRATAFKPEILLEKSHRFNFKKIFMILFITMIVVILIFAGISYWYFVSLQKTFASLEYHLKSSNLPALSSDFKDAKKELNTMQGIYDFSTNILFPFKNISDVQDIGTILDTGEKTVDSGEEFAAAVSEILPSKSGFAVMTDNISKDKLVQIDKKLSNFAATLIVSRNALEKVSLPYFPKERIVASFSPIITKLTSVYDLLPVVEQIYFVNDPKVYLVLFQNNMELRPTGGFIGSYGLLTLSGGKVLDFKIEDVYTADGQLKGHVDPPAPIRKYLAQPHFFLRDSNFDPDFASSSAQASWFLQKELGKTVDGVIGINLTLAQKLLQVVGNIRLSDFNNEEISADNFFYKVHYLSQNNFFPGSTQKKDVLTAVTNGIMDKFTTGTASNFLELLPVVRGALDEKNIQIYLENEELQKIIEEHGWAGRMVKVGCVERKKEDGQQQAADSATCLSDYLSINEANLGVNKANYFINKSTVVEKKITPDGQISTTITLSYENTNNTVVLAPQTYTNYLRVFVPIGSKLVNLTLNNAPVNPADIDNSSYGGDKTVFGTLVKVAPENKGVVKITYLLPHSMTGNITDYQMFYQKQAGDKNSPLIFSLTFPDQLHLKPVNFTSSAQGDNEVYYSTDTSVDRVFALKKE